MIPIRAVRVLLLEDSEPDAERICTWLREAHPQRFTVEHVHTLADACRRLEEDTWDVALLDLCVDDSRGLSTFERARMTAPDVPIVVQSGIALESLAIQAVSRGAQDYLVKRQMSADLVCRSLRYAIERFRVERELRETRERYRLAINGAHDGIWDWDIVVGTLFVSDRWAEMLGYGHGELGHDFDDWLSLVHPRDRDGFVATLDAHLDGDLEHFEYEHRVLHRSGQWRWMRARGLAVRDAQGMPTRIAGSLSDVTDRRTNEAKLLHQALHDELTGLPNRTLLLDRLGHAKERCLRRDTRGFAVLFLDLDRFKVVNDSMGHSAGDQLLLAVAARLRDCVRPGDTVARLGGDEFAIVVEELRGEGVAEEIATRIHRSVAVPIEINGQEVHSSVSIGIARFGQGDDSPESLLRHADIAMYRAKKSGRARSEVFDEALHAWAAGRLAVKSGLRRAVQRSEFVLHYQPIVCLDTLRLDGFEALVRWESPERGLVGPSEFIPIAEETGIIQDVGRWVLRRATHQIARLNRLLPEERCVDVSVNVSGRQLTHPSFVEVVEAALQDSGLPARRLVLELTETALMDRPGRAAVILGQLRDLGIRIHLDDFGAGYSSLGYLQRFPIDSIKIDRAFVHGMDERHEDHAIVRAILGLAEALGIRVIAEGVETLQQWGKLRDLSCGFGQGFHFSRPVTMSAAELIARDGLPPGLLQGVRAV